MTHIDTIIAEIRAEYSSLSQLNLIDDASIYYWVSNELKSFGADLMAEYETMVEVKRGIGDLPKNFYQLLLAGKCDPVGFECENYEEKKAVLQNSLFWKERVEYGQKWNSCDRCCDCEGEKTIVENIYINEVPVKFHYKKPILLALDKPLHRDPCINAKCRNRFVKNNPNSISIVNNQIYADKDFDIYVRYKGTPQDKDGKPMIPDTDLGNLLTYIQHFIEMRIFKKLWKNDDPGNYYQKYADAKISAASSFSAALMDVKMSNFDWSIYKKQYIKNKLVQCQFDLTYSHV